MKHLLYVGFSKPQDNSKIGSAVIRWFEAENVVWYNPKSWFDFFFASHVVNIFPKNLRRDFYMVSEAAGASVRFVSEPNFKDYADVVALYRLEFDQLVFDEILNYAEFTAGNPYAMLENLGIAWVRFYRFLTGKRQKNPFGKGEKAQKCSELVLRNTVLRLPGVTFEGLCRTIYIETGYKLPLDIDLIGVRDLYYIMEYLVEKGLAVRMHDEEELKEVA